MTIHIDEFICDDCDGNGSIISYPVSFYNGSGYTRLKKEKECKKCKGSGRLDWIENITKEKSHA